MDASRKFVILAMAGRLSIVILAVSFLVSFVVFVLPRFPAMGADSVERGWFIVSWNLPGPLMFISVFRIHALRVLHEQALGRKNVLRITRWVKFWFFVSVMFGVLSLAFLIISDLPSALPSKLPLAMAGIAVPWIILVSSTITLFKMKLGREASSLIKSARKKERVLLALTSIVFLIFTGFSSIVLSLPIS